MTIRYRYETARAKLADALQGLRILAGDELGGRDSTWQDYARETALNLRELADQLDAAREAGAFVQFPSPDDDDENDPIGGAAALGHNLAAYEDHAYHDEHQPDCIFCRRP